MMQELFRIPGVDLPVYGFGLMMVLGFLTATYLARYLANRAGFDGETFVNAALLGLLSGVVGARLSHVLENLSWYTRSDRSVWDNVWDAVNLQSGGLTYYGGVILATVVLVGYAIRKKIPLPKGMDIIAPCLMVGLGFGRIGCFLNGCCYGAACQVPWAVQFPYDSIAYQDEVREGKIKVPPALVRPVLPSELGLPPQIIEKKSLAERPELQQVAAHEHSLSLHPAQLYSSLTGFLIAGLLLASYTMPHVPGRIFALMLLVEPVIRFLLELLRAEPPVWPKVFGPLSYSMVMSIPLVIAGIVLWIAFGWVARRQAAAA